MIKKHLDLIGIGIGFLISGFLVLLSALILADNWSSLSSLTAAIHSAFILELIGWILYAIG